MAAMRSSRASKVDEKLLSCSICSEQYENPKILSCLHTFCERCLTRLQTDKGRRLECPVCYTQHEVPEGGVSHLKTNFFIIALLEGRVSSFFYQSICDRCSKSSASHRCVDCCLSFCSPCVKPHKKVSETRSHQVMTLDDYRKAKSTNPLLEYKVYCGVHDRNVAGTYCDTCQVLICIECVILEHHGHAFKDLKDAMDEYTKKLNKELPRLRKKEETTRISKSVAEERKEQLQAECRDEEKKVRKKAKDIISKVKKDEKRLLDELKRGYDERLKDSTSETSEMELISKTISGTCNYIETVMGHGNAAQLLSTKQETLKRIGELVAMDTNEPSPGMMQFHANEYTGLGSWSSDVCVSKCIVENLPKYLRQGDSFSLVIKTRDGCGKQTTSSKEISVNLTKPDGSSLNLVVTDREDGNHHVEISCQDEGQHQVTMAIENQPIPGSPWVISVIKGVEKRIGRKGESDGQFTLPTGLTINKNGDFITADWGNKKVQVTDKDGNHKSSITFPHLKYPFRPVDVAVSSDGDYFMADDGNRQVVVSDSDGNLIRTFGKEELKNPCAISVSPVDDTVYVTDWRKEKDREEDETEDPLIKKYTKEGNFITSFGRCGTGDGEITRPGHIAINKQGNAFVSDVTSGRILVFGVNCEYLYSFADKSTTGDTLQWPLGIAIDSSDNVYIGEHESSQIQKFNGKGCYICRVDRDNDGLCWPQGLALTKNGSIAAVDLGNHCIKVFAQ
ncbi:tripartite motif-containing protein 2-like [Glandiceps talaboti]